jgi:uncharacterized OsmC-like protein
MCADRELHDALYESIHRGDASMSAQALAQVESQQVFPISFDTATPGVAPSAVAAIPQSSSGTTAPTQPLSLLVCAGAGCVAIEVSRAASLGRTGRIEG